MAETPRIDWDAITEWATQLLSDYIRIDTSNPPGGEKGMGWVGRYDRGRLGAEDVLDEGGWGNVEVFGTRRPSFSCSISEKGPLWLRLVAEGRPGHGSVPHPDNALERLVRALRRVQDWARPVTVVPELAGFFDELYRNRIVEEPTQASMEKLAGDNLVARAILTNTVS